MRQVLLEDTPSCETAMRVPGGDAVHTVYAVAGPPERDRRGDRERVTRTVRGRLRGLGRAAALTGGAGRGGRRPSRIARGTRALALGGRPGRATSRSARARRGPGPSPKSRDRAGRLQAAFLHPVAHRTTLRVAISVRRSIRHRSTSPLATPDAVARGWHAQLDRGMRVDLPDPALGRGARRPVPRPLLGAARHGVARPTSPRSRTGASTARRSRGGSGCRAASGGAPPAARRTRDVGRRA